MDRPRREAALNAYRAIWGEESNSSTHESDDEASITSDNDSIEEDTDSSDEDEVDNEEQRAELPSLFLSNDGTEE